MQGSYSELIGRWEIFDSEVPGVRDGSEIHHFKEDHTLTTEIHRENKWHKVHFTVRPSAAGVDLLRRDGTVFVRWSLERQGPFLRLSHSLHPFSSRLRRVV